MKAHLKVLGRLAATPLEHVVVPDCQDATKTAKDLMTEEKKLQMHAKTCAHNLAKARGKESK